MDGNILHLFVIASRNLLAAQMCMCVRTPVCMSVGFFFLVVNSSPCSSVPSLLGATESQVGDRAVLVV